MPYIDTQSSANVAVYQPDSLLIQFDSSSTAAVHSSALEAIGGTLEGIINGSDDGDLARVSLGQGMTVEKAMEILSHLPGVKFAEPDYVLTSQAISNDTSVTAGSTWGLYGDAGTPTNIYGSQATEAWAAGYTGSSKVVVGVIDTGIDYTHPDLYLNIWLNPGEIPTAFRSALSDVDGDGAITFRDLNNSANGSFVSDVNGNGRIDAGDLLNDVRWENGLDEDGNGYRDDLIGWDWKNNDNDPMDDAGHGTHVSGTIGAMGGNGIGVAGVGWSTQLMALKFMDATSGATSGAVQAVDYYTKAAQASPDRIFAATNNSWGGGSYSQSLLDAITRGAKQDIMFVACAGNGGSDSIGDNLDVSAYYPACYNTTSAAGYDAVVAVAAIGSTGVLASWSNYGANTVDLAAPGFQIYSTMRGGGYGFMSGTSMATPHVAGAIAVYAAAHPEATAAQIRAALLGTTIDTASVLDKVATDGRLDIMDFLQAVYAAPPPPPPPPPPPTEGVTIVGTAGADSISPSVTVAGQPLPTSFGDTLSGLAGNDTLNGGLGADSMVGGAGDDTYVVETAGDTVVEAAGEGNDLVQSSVTYTLGDNVERLTLTGSSVINGTGNDLANIITGNSTSNFIFGAGGDDKLDGGGGADNLTGGLGSDTVSGGAGNDKLDGGAGVDLYIGNAGKDVFVLRHGEAAGDSIQDFAKGDKIQFTGFSAGSTVAKVAGTSDWIVTDGATHTTELFHVLNGYALKPSDFIFG